jgi:hypothetical protein
MVRGRYEETRAGTPQGGKLSPIPSNIMLNELDKELEKRDLGFVKMKGKWEARPHQDSIRSFERKLKKLTKRSRSISMSERIRRLNRVIRGWINHFRIGKMKNNLKRVDGRPRTRIIIWKQWKTSRKRYWGLRKL